MEMKMLPFKMHVCGLEMAGRPIAVILLLFCLGHAHRQSRNNFYVF